jgi:hypothetical protein
MSLPAWTYGRFTSAVALRSVEKSCGLWLRRLCPYGLLCVAAAIRLGRQGQQGVLRELGGIK